MNPNKRMKKKLGGAFYLSPEVIKGSYTEKCDIWACGVILYIILCGYPPFSGSTDEKIEERILLGEVSLKGEEWKEVSLEGKEFIQRLLEYDDNKRVSAEEALKDDWFKMNKRKKNPVDFEPINQKKSIIFVDCCEIRRIIYDYIKTNQQIVEDNLKLREIMESFDKDSDYHLPLDSLLKSFESFKAEKKDNIDWIDSILKSLETDLVNYNEILMLIYNERIALNKENFKETLFSISKNEQGSVLVEDLLGEMKKEPLNNDEWNNISLELQKKSQGEVLLIKDLKKKILMEI